MIGRSDDDPPPPKPTLLCLVRRDSSRAEKHARFSKWRWALWRYLAWLDRHPEYACMDRDEDWDRLPGARWPRHRWNEAEQRLEEIEE